MKLCLAESTRATQHETLRKAESIAIQQETRHTYLLILIFHMTKYSIKCAAYEGRRTYNPPGVVGGRGGGKTYNPPGAVGGWGGGKMVNAAGEIECG